MGNQGSAGLLKNPMDSRMHENDGSGSWRISVLMWFGTQSQSVVIPNAEIRPCAGYAGLKLAFQRLHCPGLTRCFFRENVMFFDICGIMKIKYGNYGNYLKKS